MKGLMALPSQTSVMKIRGIELTVRGLSISDCKNLGKRFPALDFLKDGITGMNLDKLFLGGAEAIAAFIAAGLGYGGDPDQEEAAQGLTVGEQLQLIIEIMTLSTKSLLAAAEARRHVPLIGKWRQ